MSLLSDARASARFLTGLKSFARHRITVADARAVLRRRLERRPESFLTKLRSGVFDRPRSPYLPLFKLADCAYEDVEAMVRADGLEAALAELLKAGVYVRFEELKGRQPIVREGREFPVKARDFDNPGIRPSFFARSSGSTGAPTSTPMDLDHILEEAPLKMAVDDAFGVVGVPTAQYRAIPPAAAGLMAALRSIVLGNPLRRWFTPVTADDLGVPLRTRLATAFVFQSARLLGVALPKPEHMPLDRSGEVAEWVAETLAAEGACALHTFVSTATRVALQARERGLDMTGATFMGGGEPPTPAKVRTITSCGARYVPNYAATEVGTIGVACARPITENDLHLATDALAVIQAPLEVPGWGQAVDVFYATSLLPASTKLLINAEFDDYGIIEERHCGCPLDELGHTTHVRDIRSCRKLTGEGVTLVETEAVRVLEEVLPSRFGGSPLDYQLLEEEAENGLTRLSLIVSPRVANLPDDGAVVECVLAALSDSGRAARYAAAFWRQAGSLQVKRMEPVWSAGGKFMPLCVAERLKRSGRAPAPVGGGDQR